MLRYHDQVSGYLWQPTASCDHVVIASKLSRFYNENDAVESHDRYPWCVANPRSLWLGFLDGKVELIVQLHALAKPLPAIWDEGHVLESEKTDGDILSLDKIRMSRGPLDWYLELVLFHHDALERHPQRVAQALRRGVAGIIATTRRNCTDDSLLKLATGRLRDSAAVEFLSLGATGIKSPQNNYSLVGTSLDSLIRCISKPLDLETR